MLFPPVHNCDSVEKRRDVNVKDDGELGTRRKTLFRRRLRRRRVVKNGLRETASYTRMMVPGRIINRPHSRICLGNEHESWSVLSRISLDLNIARPDVSRTNGETLLHPVPAIAHAVGSIRRYKTNSIGRMAYCKVRTSIVRYVWVL